MRYINLRLLTLLTYLLYTGYKL